MLINESLEPAVKRPEVFIMDWDGIIQYIDRTWLAGVKLREKEFEEYFDISKLRFGEKGFNDTIINRKDYYLNEWLMRNKNDKLPDDVFAKFMSLYDQDPLFYEHCNFLGAAQTAVAMAQQSFCEEIVFLSHVPYADGKDVRKQIMFDRYFSSFSDKFKLVTIHSSKPKWEWILENRPNYTCVFDDRFDIIYDIIMNTDSKMKTFMMPYLGYNKYFERDEKKLGDMEAKGASFNTYVQKFLIGW